MAHWGVFVTTPEATSTSAKVSMRTRVANESACDGEVTVETTLFDKDGNKIGERAVEAERGMRASEDRELRRRSRSRIPFCGRRQSPALYRAVSTMRKDGKVMDQVTTPFGIRSLAVVGREGIAAQRQAGEADRRQRSS